MGGTISREERLNELLALYEKHGAKLTQVLLDAYALDTAAMDRQFPHLRKVNVPKRTPNPNLQAAFSTMEDALSQQAVPRPRGWGLSFSHPDHPDYVPPTEEQKLLHWQRGGYVGMDAERAERFRVPMEEVEKANAEVRRRAAEPAPSRRQILLTDAAPKPWKESK